LIPRLTWLMLLSTVVYANAKAHVSRRKYDEGIYESLVTCGHAGSDSEP
jgi:hypothetical protein